MSDPGDSESVSQDRGSYMGRENPIELREGRRKNRRESVHLGGTGTENVGR